MDKEQLITAIIDNGNFKYNMRAHLVDNGLGALAIFFASDFDCDEKGNIEQKPCVEHKARQSVAYPLSLADEVAFNALRYMPECVNDHNVNDFSYLTIGLYLMLADAVSRKYNYTAQKGQHKTFLQVCREEGFVLPVEQDYDKDDLARKFKKVLEKLGIDQEFPNLAETWKENAQFDFQGIQNGQLKNGSRNDVPESSNSYIAENKYTGGRTDIIYGPYAVLGMHVSKMQEFLGVNTAISYARGNRGNQTSLLEEKNQSLAMLENIDRALTGTYLEERKRLGDQERAGKMAEAARRHFGADYFININNIAEDSAKIIELRKSIREANQQQTESLPRIRAILIFFPENLLRIAEKKDYTYVYSNQKNISNVYPEGKIPGFTDEEVDITRQSNGGNLSRYEFMAFSLGDRQSLKGTENEARAAAQTAIHETMHRIYNDLMTPEERETLYQLAKNLARPNDRQNEKSQIILTTSFADIMRWDSGFYTNYNYKDGIPLKIPTGPEEVICNIYSLWHTEPNRDASPLNTQEITKFVGEIDRLVQTATDRLFAPKEATQSAGLIGVRATVGTGTDTTTTR